MYVPDRGMEVRLYPAGQTARLGLTFGELFHTYWQESETGKVTHGHSMVTRRTLEKVLYDMIVMCI